MSWPKAMVMINGEMRIPTVRGYDREAKSLTVELRTPPFEKVTVPFENVVKVNVEAANVFDTGDVFEVYADGFMAPDKLLNWQERQREKKSQDGH